MIIPIISTATIAVTIRMNNDKHKTKKTKDNNRGNKNNNNDKNNKNNNNWRPAGYN